MRTIDARPNNKSRCLDMPTRLVADRRARTRKAVGDALRVAEWASRGQGVDSPPDEATLFRALQTSAYRATRRVAFKRAAALERPEWLRRWRSIRDAAVERNLGLVWCMVTQFGWPMVDREEQGSAAMTALLKAVDGFNPWLGFRFSTYACNAIRRSLVALARTQRRNRLRFPVEHDAWFETPDGVDSGLELYVDRLNQALETNSGDLTEREALILGRRFPKDGSPGLTLGEIGKTIGLSKERVRQIQKKALTKLRQVLETDPLLQ